MNGSKCPVCGSFLGYAEMLQDYVYLMSMAEELYRMVVNPVPKPDHICGSPDACCDMLCVEYANESRRLGEIGRSIQDINTQLTDDEIDK